MIIKHVIKKWVLQIFRNDPAILPIKSVISKPISCICESVEQFNDRNKNFIVTDGHIFKCDKINFLIDDFHGDDFIPQPIINTIGIKVFLIQVQICFRNLI